MTDHREYKPPQVSVDRQVDHFLDWVKVWIVQVPEEPQHTRPENLPAQKHDNVTSSRRWYESLTSCIT